MYGRRDDRFLDRGRSPGRDGYDSYDYGYSYGQNSYRSPSEPWLSSYDGPGHLGSSRESSYYDRLERPRYDYFESEGAYGGRREQYPPRPLQQGWRNKSRGSFRGNFGSPPPLRGTRHLTPPRERGAYSELSSFHSLKAFTGNSYFGGGFKKRTRNRLFGVQNKPNKERGQPAEKKMKTTAENSEAKAKESGSEADGTAEEPAQSTKTGGDQEDETEEKTDGNTEEAAQSTKTDGEQVKETQEKAEPTPAKRPRESYNRRIGDRLVEEIQFVCSICQFRTFYDEEMMSHLESDFHKAHFYYLGRNFSKKVASFLQEYVVHKTKKTEERRTHVEDLNKTIHQIHRNQDLTLGLGMEHFVKKVEAAHCVACDILIPMQYQALQHHLKSPLHNRKRKSMMENSKKRGLNVAKIILTNKHIDRKVELYKNGQNPFTNDNEKTTESGGDTDLVSVAEDSGQVACSTLSDSEKEEEEEEDEAVEEEEEEEEEEASGEQDTGQENAEDSANVCEDTEETEDIEVDATDGQ